MSEARVIKRYANRKLYDTQRSRYVTLDQIAEMIREGEDVKIIDNNSKDDLTSITLAQIIFEEEKKQKSFLPLQAMRNIIQSGGERIEELVNQAQKKVTGVFRRGEGAEGQPGNGEEPAPASESGAAQGTEGTPEAKDGARLLRELREWIAHSQKTIDDWQHKVDGRIRGVVEGISPFHSLHKEVGELSTRIIELEKKLGELAEPRDSGEH